MGDYQELRNQTADRLKQINGNFVQQELQGPFTGRTINPASADPMEKILGILVTDYDSANATQLVSSTIAPGNFSYRSTASTTYTTFTTEVAQNPAGTNVNVWKVNKAKLTNNGRQFLHRLRLLYSFLDEKKYADFLAGKTDITLDTTYDSSGDTTKVFTASDKPKDVLDYLSRNGVMALVDVSKLDSKQTNIVVIRRMCILYEMLFYLHAATYILKSLPDTPSQTDTNNANRLIQSLLSTMQKLNTNMNDTSGSDSNNSIATLQHRLQQRSAAYNSNLGSIQELDTQIKDLKVFLQGEMERLNGENETQKKTKPFEYVAIAFFIAVAVAALVLFVTPMQRSYQIAGAVVLFAVAIFVAGIFKFMFMKRVEEGFEDQLTNPEYKMFGIQTQARADMLTTIQRAVYEVTNEYLSNTIFLGLILQAYRTYGIAGYSLQKEVRHYTDKYGQMQTTRYKLRQTASVVSLEQRVQAARLSLFVSLMLIIAGTTLALVATKSMPALQSYIYGIAGFLVLLTVFVFLFEITYRVRTDGDKYYWGQPDTAKL